MQKGSLAIVVASNACRCQVKCLHGHNLSHSNTNLHWQSSFQITNYKGMTQGCQAQHQTAHAYQKHTHIVIISNNHTKHQSIKMRPVYDNSSQAMVSIVPALHTASPAVLHFLQLNQAHSKNKQHRGQRKHNIQQSPHLHFHLVPNTCPDVSLEEPTPVGHHSPCWQMTENERHNACGLFFQWTSYRQSDVMSQEGEQEGSAWWPLTHNIVY